MKVGWLSEKGRERRGGREGRSALKVPPASMISKQIAANERAEAVLVLFARWRSPKP